MFRVNQSESLQATACQIITTKQNFSCSLPLNISVFPTFSSCKLMNKVKFQTNKTHTNGKAKYFIVW